MHKVTMLAVVVVEQDLQEQVHLIIKLGQVVVVYMYH
jgi:hypothetical protein